MLLRSIRLEGWRRFANPVAVENLGAGLNVLHGPNGCGKSTLMMALVRALFDSHVQSGQDVEALRPWGRDLAPQVTLEFEHGEERYRLAKGFLERKGAELSRWEQGKFARFKEGRNADEFVRALLGGEEVKRGASKPLHWGLAQMLWVPQGKLEFTELSGGAKDLLQQSLQAQIVTAETTEIEDRIAQQYNAIFTGTGKIKAGANAPLVRLEQEEKKACNELAKLCETLGKYEEASRKIEDLRQRSEQAKASERELHISLEKTRAQVHAYIMCAAQAETLKQAVLAMDASLKEIVTKREALKAVQTEIATDEALQVRLQNDHPLLLAAVQTSETQVRTLRADADRIRGRLEEIDLARRQATDAVAFADATKRAAAYQQQLALLREADQQLLQLREVRGKIIAPTNKQLTALRKAQTQLRETKLQLDAALITLTIEPERALALECLAGDAVGTHTVSLDEKFVLRGSPEVAIKVAGLGTIRATGPAGSVEALREACAAAEKEWQKLTTSYAGASLEELEQAAQEAQEVDRQIAEWQTRANTLLGTQSREQLESEIM